MNKFRKLRFIEYNGTLEIHDSLLNLVLYGTPRPKRGMTQSLQNKFCNVSNYEQNAVL
jgi:hypothetical protein